ncbi:hypothetical protein Rleg4DRAFT_6455 [Rhizobium leguminosarum bv. trifolii WSM2297]|uniref:Uncharacterized protein n=1 Tax=Rhizobium leguminosarum bv. trifolii WSM2297 TaxID=754762 RepID=J0CV71_RHILT|nr:hypothetical protein Rleg4DRAFT_5567 [Rhizobium leguminosarum bv. trifolii WSM2297]EJC84624.1 hypothetical protein Rleg4DRAFT_6455 [Rhizobium leguminosarum bv. trifolii WSM2297]
MQKLLPMTMQLILRGLIARSGAIWAGKHSR